VLLLEGVGGVLLLEGIGGLTDESPWPPFTKGEKVKRGLADHLNVLVVCCYWRVLVV
jgi:hypothetical protein